MTDLSLVDKIELARAYHPITGENDSQLCIHILLR